MFDAGGYLYEFDYLNHTGHLRIFFYSLLIFFFAVLISTKVGLRLHISILIGFFKGAVFFIYFFYLYDAKYHFYDDIVYYSVTRDKLLNFDILYYFINIEQIRSTIGTNHIAFWTLVYLSLKIFGLYYYSTILSNIIISTLASYVLYLTLKKMNFQDTFCKLFFIFSALHWDMIAWSSFLSSKEPLMFLAITILFYNLIIINQEKKIILTNIFFIILSLILISELRTYMFIFSIFIVSGYLMFLIELPKKRIFRTLIFFFPITVLPIYVYLNFSSIYLAISSAFLILYPEIANLNEMPINFLKTLITPFPLNIQENYNFLLLPSILHYLTLILLPIGVSLSFNSKHKAFSCYIVLFLTAVTFYSFIPELAGPRQRFQYSMILMYWQFLPLYKLFSMKGIYK